MKLIGQTSQTFIYKRMIYILRVERFQDDRFRLMFICRDVGKDICWMPMKFRKGTKELDMEKVWPLVEKEMEKALRRETIAN